MFTGFFNEHYWKRVISRKGTNKIELVKEYYETILLFVIIYIFVILPYFCDLGIAS